VARVEPFLASGEKDCMQKGGVSCNCRGAMRQSSIIASVKIFRIHLIRARIVRTESQSAGEKILPDPFRTFHARTVTVIQQA